MGTASRVWCVTGDLLLGVAKSYVVGFDYTAFGGADELYNHIALGALGDVLLHAVASPAIGVATLTQHTENMAKNSLLKFGND